MQKQNLIQNHNRLAFITGGGQGIGRAVASALLKRRITVVIAEIDPSAGRETEHELSKYGTIKFMCADVARESDVIKIVKNTIKKFGRIDYLINNAAIGIGKPIIELKMQEWQRVLDVNLTGAFLCAKYAAPYLQKSKGCIVNICSTRAFMSEKNTEAYSASKGGLVALTHALAISLGPAIRVNSISPGWIDVSSYQKKSRRKQITFSPADLSQHPCGRVGTPEDIARMVLFLIAPENSFITGQNFTVDGGMTKKMIYV